MSLITENISDFISNAKCDMVTMYGDYIDSLRSGEDCGCDYRKAQKLGRLVKSLEGYTPEGQFYIESVPASAVLDFSGFDFSNLQDDMTGSLQINFDDGTVLNLVDISGDFASFTNSQYTDFIIAQINTVSGWYAAYGDAADTIFVVCPAQYGSSINTATMSINYPGQWIIWNVYFDTSYVFGALCAVNDSSSSKDGYIMGVSYFRNTAAGSVNTALTVLFYHPEKQTLIYNTGITYWNSNTPDGIYNKDTGLFYLFYPTNVSLQCQVTIIDFNDSAVSATKTDIAQASNYIFSSQHLGDMYNPIDNCCYFSAVDTGTGFYGFLKVSNDSPTSPTITFVPANNNSNGVIRPLINKITGNLLYETNTHSVAELDYLTGNESVVYDGSLLPSGEIKGIGFVDSGGSWVYLIHVKQGSPSPTSDLLTIDPSYNIINTAIVNQNSVVSYSRILNSLVYVFQIAVGIYSINYFEYNPNATIYNTVKFSFPFTPISPSALIIDVDSYSSSVFSLSRNVDLTLPDIFFLSDFPNGMTLSGFFSGGTTQVAIPAEEGCLDDTKSRTVYDKIKSLAGLCGSCDGFTPDTITPHNAFGELTGEGTYLIDDSGTYIVDENNNYILQG
jgi:hypothetical protein